MRKTSGQLAYSEVKGLLRCDSPWWIETGIVGFAFELHDENGHTIGKLEHGGRLWMYPGWMWDGSSGPTDDDDEIDPIPSGVHDEGYEGLRQRKLPPEARRLFDSLYDSLCQERGMGKWVHPMSPDAWWKFWQWPSLLNPGHRVRYYFLRTFGAAAASPIRGPQYPKRTAA